MPRAHPGLSKGGLGRPRPLAGLRVTSPLLVFLSVCDPHRLGGRLPTALPLLAIDARTLSVPENTS